MTLTPGTKLGRYEIRSKLGEGGMGEVYLAQDTELDRRVALKILPADVASNRNRMDRFVREAKSAAALSHPNIGQIESRTGRQFSLQAVTVIAEFTAFGSGNVWVTFCPNFGHRWRF